MAVGKASSVDGLGGHLPLFQAKMPCQAERATHEASRRELLSGEPSVPGGAWGWGI